MKNQIPKKIRTPDNTVLRRRALKPWKFGKNVTMNEMKRELALMKKISYPQGQQKGDLQNEVCTDEIEKLAGVDQGSYKSYMTLEKQSQIGLAMEEIKRSL